MVSLTEAVNNAIVHGNKADPTKTVEVRCELLDSVVRITVKDQGDGFRPETVDNPLKEENLLRESGRGIFLMRTLMDRVEFDRTDDGMELDLWLDLKK
jgi:serine/threonine-protein kinase RsbW